MSEKVFDWPTDSKSKMAALVITAFKMSANENHFNVL